MNLQIINGRWSYGTDESGMNDPIKAKKFTNFFNKTKEFAKGQELTHMKIRVLASIFDTDEETDQALVRVLEMSKKDINKLF